MIVKTSNKCLAQCLVPNTWNPRERVETVNDSLVPSSCSALLLQLPGVSCSHFLLPIMPEQQYTKEP